MRIIYATNSDFGKHGSIGFRTFHAALEADLRGNLLKIIARGNEINHINVETTGTKFISKCLAGIQQYLFRNWNLQHLNKVIFQKRAIKKLEPCDIFHCYDYLPDLMQAAKDMGAKVILDTQLGYAKEAEEMIWPTLKKYNMKIQSITDELRAVEIADYIICPSEYHKQTFVKHNVPEEKIKIVPQGVDIDYFKPIEKKLTTRPQFLFVGTVEPRKGIGYLMEAFKGMKADLWVAGRKNKTIKLEDTENIKFLGQVNNIRDYYNKADIFILPSLWEGGPKALYEAAACGLPIITTPNTGPFFKDRTCGHIIPIKDVNALKYSIQHFIDHPMHIRDMGKIARIIIMDYTWEKYGNRKNDFYEEIR